jgi:hypothetical protein
MSSLMIASGGGHFAAVHFQFGQPAEEAIAILGDHDRYLDINWDDVSDPDGMDMICEFTAKHLGKRAGVWAMSADFFVEWRQEWRAYNREPSWAPYQENCIRTLLWVGRHSIVDMDLPEVQQLGMNSDRAVHRAVQQTMLVQAAFYSMTQSYRICKTG